MILSARTAYVILLAATVFAGLAIHLQGFGLDDVVRDVTGDTLWATMIFWIVALVLPQARLLSRAAAALAICAGVEFGQLVDHPVLESIRSTFLGRLALGTDFDARDLAAYTAGVTAAVLLDQMVARVQTRSISSVDR